MAPDESPRRSVLFLFWFLLVLLASYRLASLSLFILDSERSEHALVPPRRALGQEALDRPFFLRHNCFTCYLVAAELAAAKTDNLYLVDHYRKPEQKTASQQVIGDRFGIDLYPYPPHFLPVPHALLAAGLDFYQARIAWFALELLVLLVTIGALVIWFGDRAFSPYWLALPLLLLTDTMLTTLQIGNVHPLVICGSLLALLLFETRRPWLGGILLALAIAAKLFPALLLLYLAARRLWSAILWTVAASIALCGVSLWLFDSEPFVAFVQYQLPRLATGEAFSFAFEHPRAMLINFSLMGAIHKLKFFELELDLKPIAGWAVWIYTAVLALVAFAAGRRAGPIDDRRDTPARLQLARSWIALLVLAELRNPFLPWGYGAMPVLLLVAFLWPADGRWSRRPVLIGALWLLFAVALPLPFGPATPALDAGFALVAVGVAICVSLPLALRSHSRRR